MRFKILSRGGYSNGGVSEKGGTMTAALFLHADPVEPLEAATKQYADNALNNLNASNFIDGILPISSLPEISGDVINTLGSNNFNLTTTGVSAGTYPKVGVDIKGRITNGFNLAQSDIPNLDWSKINAGKPTTAAGYGITDALRPNGGIINGPLISNTTPTDNTHIVTKGYVDTIVSNIGTLVSLLPGDLIRSGTTTTPSGYLRCNGGQVSKTTYNALYSVIGDAYSNHYSLGNGKPWKDQYGINITQTDDLVNWSRREYPYALPVSIRDFAIVNTGSRVYIIGGYNGVNVLNTVYTATIGYGGALGQWSATTNFISYVTEATAIMTNGTTKRVYVLGCKNSSFDPIANVYVATVNGDGTINAFTATTSLPSALSTSQVVQTSGTTKRVYLLGGITTSSTVVTTVYTASIAADGTLGAWSTGTALPSKVCYGRAFISDKSTTPKVHLIGGFDGTNILNTVYTAPINADGTIGTWALSGNLSVGLMRFSLLTYFSDKVYILGGNTSTGMSSAIYVADIAYDNALGSWSYFSDLPDVMTRGQVILSSLFYSRIYLFAGFDSNNYSNVVYTTFMNMGQPQTWISSSNSDNKHVKLVGTQSFITKDRVYQVGGYDGSVYVNSVYTATFDNNNSINNWTSGTNFPINIAYGQLFITKNRVYYAGGINGSTVSSVYSATINADGTIGTWVSMTNLPAALAYSSVIVTRSRVYLLGGHNGSSELSLVYVAAINSDGTLGSWTTGTNLPVTLQQSQSVIVKNKVYLFGGYSVGAAISTIYSADLNADGTIGTWTSVGNLPIAVYNAQVYSTNNKINLVGGRLNSTTNNYIQYSCAINTDGTLGAWKGAKINNSSQTLSSWITDTSGPFGIESAGGVVTEGTTNRLYIIGGNKTISSGTRETYYANINADGTLGSWNDGPLLPAKLANFGIAITPGTTKRVYVLGGYGDNTYTGAVYYANINADGTLSAWSTGTSLPSAVYSGQVVVTTGTSNRIHYIGGMGGNQTTVYTAIINSNGTLGTWTTGTSLPDVTAYRASAIVTNGTTNRVYVMGGMANDIYTTNVNTDGSLGNWTKITNALPDRCLDCSAILVNNRVYLLAGYTDLSRDGTYFTAPVNSDGTLGTFTVSEYKLPLWTYKAVALKTTGSVNRAYVISGTVNGSDSYSNVVYRANIIDNMPIGGYGLQVIANKTKLYILNTTEGSQNPSVYYSDITGGLNDYSKYYDGSLVLTDSDKFSLPDYSNKELYGTYSYIKY